ncbi:MULTISPECIES: TadE/TadG family type IV pilus assembly protein [unclassified Bradyrhizobium]|uniref:TadE/TadG family type IV pilus assembly protein n=1 Tax=unclassified Bradyrhizobium TaxID=2631580 RepID=UPI00040EDF8D|nr:MULTISPECIES: TadE/TadG family type IV pilus assembly protein [unclassified Bradyrhizobium]MCP3462592.1 pilus assembly protein [Bradyrhizobium sp. CCGUVB23]
MIASLSSRARDLCTDVKAVAATEFAIVLPFMLVLYVGGVELGNGLAMNVKVSETAHSLADMVSQNTQVTDARMQAILGAATAIMAPYPIKNASGASLITITVSEVSTDKDGNATVQWSVSNSSSAARTVGQQMTLSSFTAADPKNPTNANLSLILSEVSYDYTPNLGYSIAGTVKLSDSYYLFPRCSTNSPTTSTFPYYDVKYPATTICTCIQHVQEKSC